MRDLSHKFAAAFGRQLARELWATVLMVALLRAMVRFLRRHGEAETAATLESLQGAK